MLKVFEVLEGVHHQDGVVFKKGQCIESHSDLCAVFKNKFRQVQQVALRPVLVAEQARVAVVAPVETPPEVEPQVVPENEETVSAKKSSRRRR